MRLLTILFLIFSSCTTNAQDGKLLRFEKVNGLSQNTVYSIMQDKQGFMWVATADGLNRFDGNKIVIYKPSPLSNKGELTGRIIRTGILEDEHAKLWFSTEIGLFRFDKRKGDFTMVSLKNDSSVTRGISANPVFKSDTLIWLLNSTVGAISYHEATGVSKIYPVVNADGSANFILQEGASLFNGIIYTGGKEGLFQFDTRNHQWKLIASGAGITCTAIINHTIYWNAGKDVYFRNIKSGLQGKISFASMKQKSPILCMYADFKGNLYVGDGAGNIYVKNTNAQSFNVIGNINQYQDANPVYPVLSIFVNRSGVLFAGGDVVGLHKADLFRPYFNIYPSNASYTKTNDLFVTSIAEDETGNIIAGSYQGGLHWKKKGSDIFTPVLNERPLPEKSKNKQTSMVHRDDAGNFWLCYGNELFLFKKGQTWFQKIITQKNANVVTESLQVFCVMPVDDTWYLGTNIGLMKIEKHGEAFRSLYLPNFGQTNVKCMWYESKNRLWLGFESGGISIVDPESDYRTVHSFLDGAGTKSFAYDSTHAMMYISTMSGLVAYHIPTGNMKIFTEKDGLRNSYIYGVIIGNNELWASSNRGLSRASIRYQIGQLLPSATFTNFTSKDGLPDDEFNTGAFYKGQDGIFYFGTIKGLVWFNPNDLKPNQQIPDIIYTEIRSKNSGADAGIAAEYIKTITLPYSGNEMQFKFQALEYANIEVVEYAYQMEGWDKDWVYSQQLNEVRYANLSPGKYFFKAKARKSGGPWSPEKTIFITIEPPFYKTYWFYTLALFFIITSIVLLTRNIAQRKLKTKIEELERQKSLYKERLRISREMHDDIGAGLTQIVLMSESVKNKTGMNVKKELSEITDASRQLVNNMGEIIWSMNPGNTTLEHIMAHLREQLHKQLEYAGIQYTIQLPENGKEIILPNEKRRNILLITREIVNNAIKHSKANNISIKAVLTKDRLTFKITDDGIGFDTEQVKNGNGLKNIKHRITEMGGEIIIEPLESGGLSSTYFIPFDPTT